MSDSPKNEFMQKLNPDDVQSVSAGGVSITLRDKAAAEKSKWQLELEKRRAAYNPLLYGNFNDRNQRR